MKTKTTKHDELVEALRTGHRCTLDGRELSLWGGGLNAICVTVNTGRGRAFTWLQNDDVEKVIIKKGGMDS